VRGSFDPAPPCWDHDHFAFAQFLHRVNYLLHQPDNLLLSLAHVGECELAHVEAVHLQLHRLSYRREPVHEVLYQRWLRGYHLGPCLALFRRFQY